MRNCKDCEYCDEDYVFDEELEDEYLEFYCEKGNDTSINSECNDFQKHTTKYIEKDTRCDKCKRFKYCKDYLLEVTNWQDTKRHYINGTGHICRLTLPKDKCIKVHQRAHSGT